MEDLVDRAFPQEFRVRLDTRALTPELLDRLETIFGEFAGVCAVVFELRSPDGYTALLPSQLRVRSCPELLEAVRPICDEGPGEMAATA